MPLKHYKPTTPGRRHASILTSDVTKREPERGLIERQAKHAGRNAQGKITTRHRGGGHKRFYRLIDFKQDRFDAPAEVVAIEYDPNRTTNLALIRFQDGEMRYILAATGLVPGRAVVSARTPVPVEVGNRTKLEHIPSGMLVHNVELEPGRGGVLVRSAGAGARLMAIEGKFAQLKMPSGEVRLVPKDAMASIGQLGNVDHVNVRLGKAGRLRWRGIKPTVRGKAMNPVDHPHGGGEGVQPIGLKHPKTPWGRPALGVKTRRQKSSDRLIVQRRRKG
ncbi:MAG: 50S ribosomal protein L2 [Candidatus Kerfeldbacteria bacterium]|nr:50S ribosomal protein L2 [Candidatus Kerfeldbacteria bacterium]